MSNAASFCDALRGIGSRIDGDMSEKDVENAFLNENFMDFSAMRERATTSEAR